jgi:glycosyltransferase involved in cell wall biosynthesis
VRILIHSQSFPPQTGGVERIVTALAEGLARLGPGGWGPAPEITVATSTPAGEMDDLQFPFRVIRRPRLDELVMLLWNADIIHLAGPALLPLFVGWLMQKRLVIEHHGFQTVCPNGQLFYEPEQAPCPGHFMAERHLECLRCNAKYGKIAAVKLWLLTFPRRRLCEMSPANVTPTDWLSTVLRLPRSQTIVHGVRITRQIPSPDLVDPATFVFVGRLVATKGVGVLLAAAQNLNNKGYIFRVRIIGDGPDREELQKKAASVGPRACVEFLGQLSDEGIERAIAGAVAVIMPSLAGEVFGLVAAENMLRGRPIIASDIGALREVVGDAGLFFPPGNDTVLMAHMEDLLLNVRKAERLGREALRRAARLFSESRMVDEHNMLYQRLSKCAE